MWRLIEADALIDVIEREPWVHITDYNIAFYAVKHAPTVDAVPREIEQANKQAAYVRGYEDGQKDKYGRWVDAVEVVRCKDCIRYLPDGEVWGRCRVIPYRLRNNDFCSYGVSKDGEQCEN